MKSQILTNKLQLINNPNYSDIQITTQEGTTIHLCMEFLSKAFLNEVYMFEFIEYLHLCSKETCLSLLEFAYLGMGSISE